MRLAKGTRQLLFETCQHENPDVIVVIDQNPLSLSSILSLSLDDPKIDVDYKSYVHFKDSVFTKYNVRRHYDNAATAHYIRFYKSYVLIKNEYRNTTNLLIKSDLKVL